MQTIYSRIKRGVYDNLIKPALVSVAPINEIALGTSIGLFVGLTPTVGIQMWIVFLIWLFFRYILHIRFELIVATACVWISNALTMVFIYYIFLVTGVQLFSIFGMETVDVGFQAFSSQFSRLLENADNGIIGVLLEGSRFLLVDLGIPMLIGSLVYAVPLSILGYFLTYRFLLGYRKIKAQKAGLDYETWRNKYERVRPDKRIKEFN